MSGSRWVPLLAAVAMFCAAGCGESQPPSAEPGSAPIAAGAGAEIEGNLAPDSVDGEASVLVFAYPGSEADPTAGEPLSVGVVDPDGSFVLSGLDAQSLTLVFLSDTASDGVIDAKDPVAVLTDPDHQMGGLQAGDRVVLGDVRLEFDHRRAVAEKIELVRATPAPVVFTPTAVQESPAGE